MECADNSGIYAVISSVIIGAVTGYLLYKQNQIAAQKRNDDLFEVRMGVLLDLIEIWRDIINNKNTLSQLEKWRITAYKARFLFGEEIFKFMNSQYRDFIDMEYYHGVKSYEQGAANKEMALSKKLSDQHDAMLKLFEPYLKIPTNLERPFSVKMKNLTRSVTDLPFHFAGAAARTGFLSNLPRKVWHTCKSGFNKTKAVG